MTTLEVRGSLKATVDQLSDVILTPDQLTVVVTSLPVPVDDIRYVVTTGLRHGELISVDDGAILQTFTQADINAGRVLYRHRDVTSLDDDHFRFQVGDGGHVGEELEFTVDVSESSTVIALSASNLTVIEGQSTFVDGSTLVLADRYVHSAEPVVFSVLTQPSHGRLEATDRPAVRLTQFTSHQLTGSLVTMSLSRLTLVL